MADALHIRARTIPPPKVFISYRWESEAHSAWVAHFVAELKKRGVRVVFDRDVKRANDEAGKRRDRNDDL